MYIYLPSLPTPAVEFIKY